MNKLWNELQKLSNTEIELRDLHEAVDELPNCRVIAAGKRFERDGKKFQPVKICLHGFRPISVIAVAA